MLGREVAQIEIAHIWLTELFKLAHGIMLISSSLLLHGFSLIIANR